MIDKIITFDDEKCTRCDICVSVCPVQIISREGKEKPDIPEKLYSLCRKCGHCEVYCPADAVSSHYAGEYPSGNYDISDIDAGDLKKYLLSRRTSRVFQEEPVDKATLEEIMDTVRFAPTASNKQSLRWIMVSGRDEVHQIGEKVAGWMQKAAERDRTSPYSSFFEKLAQEFEKGKDMITRDAPNLIFPVVPSGDSWAETDSAIALTWFEILCQSYNIGTCWLGLVRIAVKDDPLILGQLSLPHGYELGCPMAFGYSKIKVHGFPKRKPADITWI